MVAPPEQNNTCLNWGNGEEKKMLSNLSNEDTVIVGPLKPSQLIAPRHSDLHTWTIIFCGSHYFRRSNNNQVLYLVNLLFQKTFDHRFAFSNSNVLGKVGKT